MENYVKRERSDNTVRIDTPLGHHIWVTRDPERNHLMVHTSICLAGHMYFVDDLNELPYVTVNRVTNHEKSEAGGALSTVDLITLSENAMQMIVVDLPDIYEREFHEQRIVELDARELPPPPNR